MSVCLCCLSQRVSNTGVHDGAWSVGNVRCPVVIISWEFRESWTTRVAETQNVGQELRSPFPLITDLGEIYTTGGVNWLHLSGQESTKDLGKYQQQLCFSWCWESLTLYSVNSTGKHFLLLLLIFFYPISVGTSWYSGSSSRNLKNVFI